MAGAGVAAEVAGSDQQLGAQDGPETGHRLDGHGLMVATERRSDLVVKALDALVELKKAPSELGDDHLRHLLARQFDVLTAGGGQSACGDAGGVAHVPAAQPLG
jgi:hypothetical protein